MSYTLSLDTESLKGLPGYKLILKTVLKAQIQHLVEQLAQYADEESVLLTASTIDGTLSHIGSPSGRIFLDSHEEFKSTFLKFCINHQTKSYQKTSPSKAKKRSVQSKPGSRPSVFSSCQNPFKQTKLTFTPVKHTSKKTEEHTVVNNIVTSDRPDVCTDHQVTKMDGANEHSKETSGSETYSEWQFVDVEDLMGDDTQSEANKGDSEVASVSDSGVEEQTALGRSSVKRKRETTDSEEDVDERLELEVECSDDLTPVIKVEPDWDGDEESSASQSEQQPSTSNATPEKSKRRSLIPKEMLCRGDRQVFKQDFKYNVKRKRSPHTLTTKYKAICEVEAKKRNITDIANDLDIPHSTLCTWKKNAAAIKEMYEGNLYVRNRKSMKCSNHSDIEAALLDWIKLMHSKGTKLNSKIIQKKSIQIAKLLGYSAQQFKGSKGWIGRFRGRYGLKANFEQKDVSTLR